MEDEAVAKEESLQVWAGINDAFQHPVVHVAANEAEASEFMHRLYPPCFIVTHRVVEIEPEALMAQAEMLQLRACFSCNLIDVTTADSSTELKREIL